MITERFVFPEEKIILVSMDLVEGKDLSFFRVYSGGFTVECLIAIFRQVAKGLHWMHHNNIVHLDLKPENIMLEENGSTKICDTGLAAWCRPGQRLTRHCGTTPFMAPEHFAGNYNGPSADVWGFGATVYSLVTSKVLCEEPVRSDPHFYRAYYRQELPLVHDLAIREFLQDIFLPEATRSTLSDVITSSWMTTRLSRQPQFPIRPATPLPDDAYSSSSHMYDTTSE
ncbi:unnamed protein product, partial [Mesorhabditis spiculigera]